jgi:hypothetical protein
MAIERDTALLQEIMRRASRAILPVAGGLALKSKANIVKYPNRYSDRRGVFVWNLVTRQTAEAEDQHVVA